MSKLTRGLFFFKQAFNNLRVFKLLWQDFRSGRYRAVPIKTMAAIGLFFVYILNPFDLISDLVLLWGQLDDFAVLMFCLYLLDQDTSQYETWRKQEGFKYPDNNT